MKLVAAGEGGGINFVISIMAMRSLRVPVLGDDEVLQGGGHADVLVRHPNKLHVRAPSLVKKLSFNSLSQGGRDADHLNVAALRDQRLSLFPGVDRSAEEYLVED